MATSSYAKSLLGGLAAEIKAAVGRALEYVFDGNLRFGPVEHQTRTENFAGIYLNVTTSSTADAEFSVAHGLPATPKVMWPVLDPYVVGSRAVRLEVSRAADSRRIYLRSPEASAAITLYVES